MTEKDQARLQALEALAKRIKTIDDITEWYKPEIEKRRLFYKGKAEYNNKAMLYTSKEF